MKRNKIAVILLALAVLTVFPGCKKKESVSRAAEEEAREIYMIHGVTSGPQALIPFGLPNAAKRTIRQMIYESLYWMDESGKMHPILAKNYEKAGDGVYRVTLFENITDSAGNKLTASDVMFSLQIMKDVNWNLATLANLADAKVVGDYAVEFTFKNERMGNIENLLTDLYCLTEAAYSASPDKMVTTPVGTGRYVLTDMVKDSWYELKKRDGYWQTDASYIVEKNAANIDRLRLEVITDASTLAIALENGEIDYTQQIETADRVNFMNDDGKAKPGFIVKALGTSCYIHLTFNCSKASPCRDINLRKAIAYCIDSAAIAKNIQGPLGKVSQSGMVPFVLDADPSLNNTGNYYPYDVAKAKEYLAKSGYKGETLKVIINPNVNTNNSGVMIQAYCEAIGVKLELSQMERALYTQLTTEETGTKYDIDLTGLNSADDYAWRSLSEMDIKAYRNGLNHNFIKDDKLQKLYENAAGVATGGKTAANELIQYIDDQCYLYSLYTYDNLYMGRDRIKKIVTGKNADSICQAFEITP
jgi:ABC-type transport system substrate-binding protein